MGTISERVEMEMRAIKELRDTFLEVFDRLPEAETRMPIVVINHRGIEQPCSWRVVKLEVDCDTRIGKTMLRQLERLRII